LECHFSSLTSEGLLIISGPDTLVFLQGQTTCDTGQVGPGKAVPGAYCTPKGRVVCDFLLLQIGEESYGLRMRRNIIEHAASTLGKYIIFSKADIELQQTWQVSGIWGDDARQFLENHYGVLPKEQYTTVRSQAGILTQLDNAGNRFEYFCQTGSDDALSPALENKAKEQNEQAWRAGEILHGLARVEAATVEEFVPQTLNYDITGHVNFKKGCYTGQEVVARLHYRGKPKRRSYACVAPRAVDIGASVYSAETSGSVGQVVNAAQEPAGRQLLLVAATISGAEQGLRLDSSDGPELSLLELPYALPE